MAKIWLRCDLRSADFGIPATRVAKLHLEQAAWADKLGFETVQFTEHHGSSDGCNPSPFVLGGAIAARTERIRLNLFALLLPLHDAVRVAEDAAVLDIIADGRLDLTVGVGYVPSEFDMFGVSLKDRARRVETGIDVLRRAFAGEDFVYEGRPVSIRPVPPNGGPRIFVGGNVPASARRAARLGDGFAPAVLDQELVAIYENTCRELGKDPVVVDAVSAHQFLFVAEDPEAAWHKIAPFAFHETNMYAKNAATTDVATPYQVAEDVDALKATGLYQVLTPDECIEYGKSLHDRGTAMIINPTLCGLDEDFSWSSLQLFADKVLPQLPSDESVRLEGSLL